MPAYSSSLPALTLVTNDPEQPRRERPIDRAVLLDIAPDRETLILSDKSTEELRQALKIRVASSSAGHWLYRNRRSTSTSTDVLDPTSRMSTYIHKDTSDALRENVGHNLHVVRRRVLSASSISPLSLPMTSIENRLASAEGGLSCDIWASMTLSTADKLISPRPLGPTHILIAYSAPPKPSPAPHAGREVKALRRGASTALSFPGALELPVNDLLFTLNAPNLSAAFPRRLHKELPRVLLRVPHLATLPELVIYLHTKNQAALFRALVPEWMRDIMHPLPTGAATSTPESRNGSNNVGMTCRAGRFFGMLVQSSAPDSGPEQGHPTVEAGRSIDSIARELADAARPFALPGSSGGGGGADLLLRTVSRLDALWDNLDNIGYFGKDVWSELGMCREILVRAVSWGARMEGRVGEGLEVGE